MTPKERLFAEIGGRGDACPVVLPYLGIFLRDHWREVTEVPWWAVRAGDVKTHLQMVRDLQRALRIDWAPISAGPSRRWRETHEVRTQDVRAFLVDLETGQEHEIFEPPPGGEQNVPRDCVVFCAEDVDRLVKVPRAEQMIGEGRFDAARAVVREFGADHFILGSVSAPLWGLHSYFGFYGMMTNLVEQPELVEYLLERLTESAVEYLKAYAWVGADGVWIEDCYTSADLISLPHFRRFAVPYVRRLIETTRELGMRSIHYFCGDVSDRLEDLVALRPTCLSLEESKKGFRVDIEDVARQVAGRVCLLGNIDAVGALQDGGERAMAAEIRRQVAAGRREGPFVISLGSPVTPCTPTAKVRRFVDLAREIASEEFARA